MMTYDDQRDTLEEQYWRDFCHVCGASPCESHDDHTGEPASTEDDEDEYDDAVRRARKICAADEGHGPVGNLADCRLSSARLVSEGGEYAIEVTLTYDAAGHLATYGVRPDSVTLWMD